jgi:glutamate-ammonia-ligase adenylyltransferase
MTRARFVLGDAALSQRFDAVRLSVISAARDKAALRLEIMAMRGKVRAAHPIKSDQFDVKHSPGGMVDVEFVVQYLVLADSGQHDALTGNIGNIGLLNQAERVGLLSPGVGLAAASAYRELRQIQHRARLDEQTAHSGSETAENARKAVDVLWNEVFGPR